MASKFNEIRNLADDTLLQITQNRTEWSKFLDTAAWLYKYNCSEQVLIYAQKPEAKACASMEVWNTRLNRWINKGAKGIALPDENSSYPKLKYVFDVSDTHPNYGEDDFELWDYLPNHSRRIFTELENRFGSLKRRGSSLGERITLIADTAVIDNIPAYFDEYITESDHKVLETSGQLNQEDYAELVWLSVRYMVLRRLGYSPTLNFDNFHLENIQYFNDISTASHILSPVSEISSLIIRQIEKSVLTIRKEEQQKFAQITDNAQDILIDGTTNTIIERSSGNGNNLHEEGRHTDSGSDYSGRNGQDTDRQIRAVKETISERTQAGDVREPDIIDQTPNSSQTDRQTSQGANRENNIENSEKSGSGREIESPRPDEMGRSDELDKAAGGRGNAEQSDIQITENDEISVSFDEKPTEKQSAGFSDFGGFPAEYVHDALRFGSNNENSLYHIAYFFTHKHSLEEKIEFLRKEYRTGGFGFYVDDQAVSAWFNEDGITFSYGKNVRESNETHMLSWGVCAIEINKLLNQGKFVSEDIIEISKENEAAEIASDIFFKIRDLGETFKHSLWDDNDFPNTAINKVKEKLLSENGSEEVEQTFSNAVVAYHNSTQWHYRYNFEEMGHRIKNFSANEIDIQKTDFQPTERNRFITEDELDFFFQNFSHAEGNRYLIYEFFKKESDSNKRSVFLKNTYGIGGSGNRIALGQGDEWHDAKGITICKGKSGNPYVQVKLKWNAVSKIIGKLIETERYLSKDELNHYPDYLKEREEHAKRIQEENLEREAELRLLEKENEARKTANYDYFIGNEVSIFGNTHTILDITDDIVTVDDPSTPLIPQEISKREFEEQLRLYPANDYLIVENDNQSITQSSSEEPINNEQSAYEKVFSINDENKIENKDLIGKELQIDNRRFLIEEIREFSGDVSLIDITFESNVGIPISRIEKIDYVLNLFKDQNKQIEPQQQVAESAGSQIADITAKAENYHITDFELGYGTKREKAERNILAIKLLKQIEKEERIAMPEEQEILSQYVGWGGITEVFDENNTSWQNEYEDLKDILSEDEYEAARASVLNAHYTSPTVIKAIYDKLSDMGFSKGNILEPSCGVGNFFGMLPETMSESKLYGTELDSITGRIAEQLYPKADIKVQGFENSDYQDSFFDVAIGNVPFGDYQVIDKKFEKYHFSIHDYFVAKTLDKVRNGGLVAVVISRFTMDKKDTSVRKYIAERAELLGAVRLPNNAFLKNAGTAVTSDILFLKKRERPIVADEPWIQTYETEDGLRYNSYFAEHPEMVLGTLSSKSTQYGTNDITCVPIEGADLGDQLKEALNNIDGEYEQPELDVNFDDLENAQEEILPADPAVRNYSYTVIDDKIYFRRDSVMTRVKPSLTAELRIKGMIKIRDTMRELIRLQTVNAGDEEIEEVQRQLNEQYDTFTKKYGLLNSRGNQMAFSDDSAYYLICSLEVLDEDGKLERKADMFSKRTIRNRQPVTSVDTPLEALTLSLSERGRIDMEYMESLTRMSEEEMLPKLYGSIYRDISKFSLDNPGAFDISDYPLVTADEFLSGNVRKKLEYAKVIKEFLIENNENEEDVLLLQTHIEALEKVQPKDLTASEIDVRLGATWIPPEYIQQFMEELLNPPIYLRDRIKVSYSKSTATWNISSKSWDGDNVAAITTYGTNRMNAYKIIEETLNLKDVRIFDKITDSDGSEKRVLNTKETMVAQQKQQSIKDAFREWIWKDLERRDDLTRLYNDKFNSICPREFDGSNLQFLGMNPEIQLQQHQLDAVARIIYGGNTLLAHVVGAGKTYEMAAAAMELKRLGLCQKSLFVVPNHLTGQWGAEFLQLYPAANILVATKKDFETANRKKFCARIASGDYDAVIIGHSQFERIPLSIERQAQMLKDQIAEAIDGIREVKEAHGERFTIKQMEKSKRQLEVKLRKLTETGRKDDVINFEELGIDRLFVDEAHHYKNLYLYTKMRNVAGLSQSEAQKSADLFGKTRYMDELTDGKGTVFATGTPISNSMTELYTMQRYLQYDLLAEKDLRHFDAWASSFGETITTLELKPEGTGYRQRTRFAKFYNLPELLTMFKECSDIKTSDILNLPVPKANYHTVISKPSEYQVEMVKSFGERAEKVRAGVVQPQIDNMLKITNDGRKLALDQRLINEMLEDDENSKVNECVKNIFEIYTNTNDERGTQLVFSDLSTPHSPLNLELNDEGEYELKTDEFNNVYEDIAIKLMQKGVPKEEIAFIHDANTDAKKIELFSKVRSGKVRVLLGSTAKMGAGTNVQTRLKALHHLDIPWVPCSIEQREGRAIRQGNQYDEVDIYRYVTENTFDSYMWQTLENKQKFIGQIMTSKAPVRSCEDVDETALSYAEVKMLATGNPHIKEKMDLEIDVAKLRVLKSDYLSKKYSLEDKVAKYYPNEIQNKKEIIKGLKQDLITARTNLTEDFKGMEINGVFYEEKKKAGEKLIELCKKCKKAEETQIGSYKGFEMNLFFDLYQQKFFLNLKGEVTHRTEMGADPIGNITRIENTLKAIESKIEIQTEKLTELEHQFENAKEEIEKPFLQEEELKEKEERLTAVTLLLNLDERASDAVDFEPDETPTKNIERER